MNTAYLDALSDHGGTLITHIALFEAGSELAGGAPAYARLAVTWTASASGLIRPAADLDFDIPSGATVDEWRGFTALTGGTDYGGQALTPEGPYAAQGTYKLKAAETAIDLDAA